MPKRDRSEHPGSPPPTFRKILVPVDFARASQAALHAATGLLRGSSGEIHLLHVIETIEHLGFWSLRPFYRELRKAAEARMGPMLAKLARDGVKASHEILRGHRVSLILECALRERVDIIVLGSHRVVPGSSSSGWSTVSHNVALFSSCPVLLVK